MQTDGTLDIKIIQGDSYRREITVEGISLEDIEGVYFSCSALNICKLCPLEKDVYVLLLEASETEKFSCSRVTYDLTIKFKGNIVQTMCYNASLIVFPKTNKVVCNNG